MALQRIGKRDMVILLSIMEQWKEGSLLEQRAAAAALCEPVLLVDETAARRTLQMLDDITVSLRGIKDRHSEAFRVLRQGLGYCWSVAVAALPAEGKPLMEKWLKSEDKDVQWTMKENLGKARLARMDATWVEQCKAQLH